MIARRNLVQIRFIGTTNVFITLNSGFLFAGVIFTWISVQIYYGLLGGGLDLYPGYYKGLGQILRFLPLGMGVTLLTFLAYWCLPKSKWTVGVFLPELVVDAIIISDYLAFVESLLGKKQYILPVYPCFGLGILFLMADVMFVFVLIKIRDVRKG